MATALLWPSICSLLMRLCGLFIHGFHGNSRGLVHADLDLFGFEFFALGQRDVQYPVFKRSIYLLRVHPGGKSESPGKFPIAALDPVEVVLLFLVLEFALPRDGQKVVFERNVEVFFLHARYLRLQGDVMLIFENVDWRKEIRRGQRLLKTEVLKTAESLIEELVHTILQ